MERGGSSLGPGPEFERVLACLDDPECRGVMLLGPAGSGKTTLLEAVRANLAGHGRPVFRISTTELRYGGDLGTAAVETVAASRYGSAIAQAERIQGSSRVQRSSKRDVSQSESISILSLENLRLERPVLLLDAVDESPFPERVLSAVSELSVRLHDWQFVVASRAPVRGHPRGFESISLDYPGSEFWSPEGPPGTFSSPPAPSVPQAPQGEAVPSPPVVSVGPVLKIKELAFGSEAAEHDELLELSYVQRPFVGAIGQRKTIVLGDRGSGKSAIFRRLSSQASDDTDLHPVTNAGDLLHQTMDGDDWLDTDRLRAAWLVVVASRIATVIGASASKKLRRDADVLRAAAGSPRPVSPGKRVLWAILRGFAGTTLKLGVGPAEMEVQLPSGAGVKPGNSSVDVKEFLRQADQCLGQRVRRSVVAIDRIDETFKYDRPKQQAIVQALLQAEAEVLTLKNIRMVVFLRTDLFELYDIQERNKLVSRTLTLDWEEEDWFRMLVRRAFSNEQVRLLARAHGIDGHGEDGRAGLEVLFPSVIEEQPVDRWLLDSLRNGNGNVSPRLAVLLLYLVQERARPEVTVSERPRPLFSAGDAIEAMTKLSDLSFMEVVNDFKIATSFVRNCRAAKLETFTLAEVSHLFDEDEGQVNDQVSRLERLGFLERIVRDQPMFRIPRLYTRCW